MSARLNTNLPALKNLYKSTPARRKIILRKASSDLILSICELAFNLLRGNIPLTARQYQVLKRQKKWIKLFANKRASVATKRKVINQNGGFLLPLLSVAVPFITSLIASRKG